MTVTRFSQASLATPIKYRTLMAGSAYLPQPTDFQLISTQLISTATASVTFSSLPTTFRHLQLRVEARTTTGNENDALVFQFNGDTAANYAFHGLFGTGTSALSGASVSQAYGNAVPAGGDGAAANIFGAGVLDILDYALTTKNKTSRGFGGAYSTSTGAAIRLNSSLWMSTAAITSILIRPANPVYNIKAGSRLSLYGWN